MSNCNLRQTGVAQCHLKCKFLYSYDFWQVAQFIMVLVIFIVDMAYSVGRVGRVGL